MRLLSTFKRTRAEKKKNNLCWARNREGIRLSYRPARLHRRLNWFLGIDSWAPENLKNRALFFPLNSFITIDHASILSVGKTTLLAVLGLILFSTVRNVLSDLSPGLISSVPGHKGMIRPSSQLMPVLAWSISSSSSPSASAAAALAPTRLVRQRRAAANNNAARHVVVAAILEFIPTPRGGHSLQTEKKHV
jgi:hypothetical protein